jgi:DDE_Tnp_1-associated
MVCDGGRDRGRDHPVAVVLSLCAAAVLAAMRSFTAIAGWVADVPVELLSGFYAGAEAKPPSKSTLWRVLTGVDPAAVDAVIGSWLAEHAGLLALAPVPDAGKLLAVAVDGKTLRGAVDANGARTHVLGAGTHVERLMLGQVQVSAKTNEIAMFAPLLDQLAEPGIDPGGLVVTADALHTQAGAWRVSALAPGTRHLHRQAQPARAIHRAHRAALGRHANRSPGTRPRSQPADHSHHPGPTRTHRPALSARQTGLADRTLRQRPGRAPDLGDSRARRDQPER